MRHLYIIRHGQTEWNAEKRMQGRFDSSLTELGRQQAQVNGETVRSHGGVDLLLSSPLGRTRETTFVVNSILKAQVHYHDALVERDCGEWSGLTVQEIEAQYPREWAARHRDPHGHRPPGGENLPDILARSQEFLDSLFEYDARSIALVTHGIFSRVAIGYFMGLTAAHSVRVRHPNDLVYRLEFRGDEVVAEHFRRGKGPREGLLVDEHPGDVVAVDGSAVTKQNHADDPQ